MTFTFHIDLRKSRDSLAGCFWLRVSHEAAVRLSAGTAIIWRLDWGWRACCPGVSLTGLLTGGLSSPTTWISPQGPSGVFTTWQLASPEWVIQASSRRKPQCLVWHGIEATHIDIFIILFIWSKSFSPLTLQGKGISSTLQRQCQEFLDPSVNSQYQTRLLTLRRVHTWSWHREA